MEHVPPQCIFRKPLPSNLIKVPSCDKHNSKKSKDDEYFRWFIATACAENKEAEKLINEKVIKGFKRRPKLLHEIWKGARKNISIYSDGGIFIGEKPGFVIDSKRIQNSLNQMCRGLFYKHFKLKLPREYGLEDFIHYPRIDDKLKGQICSLKLNDIGDGNIFSYRFMICGEDSNIVMWFFMFYSHFLIMCMSKRL